MTYFYELHRGIKLQYLDFIPKINNFKTRIRIFNTWDESRKQNILQGRKTVYFCNRNRLNTYTMTSHENPTRLFDIVEMQSKAKLRRPCFRYGEQEVYANDYLKVANQLSYALLARGLKRGEVVALIAENRPEWNIIDMAVMQAGGVMQPLCKGLSAEEYVECLRKSQVRTIFLENKELFMRFKLILPQVESLGSVVTIEPDGDRLSYPALLEEGAQHPDPQALEHRRSLVSTDDVCVLTYTGGGTYNRLTHKMLLEDIVEQAATESNRRQAAAGNNALCTLYGRTKNYVCQLIGRTVNYPLPDTADAV